MHRYLLWTALPILLTLIGCGEKDDTRAVRRLIESSATMAEKHHIRELMQLTTEDFMALPGGYDTRIVRGILFRAFNHYGQFKIHFPHPSIEVTKGGHASAVVYFIIMSKDRSVPGLKELYDDPLRWIEKVGEKADLYQLRLDLVKKDMDWLVRQAHIERLKGGSFEP